jgi:predicted membrane protein
MVVAVGLIVYLIGQLSTGTEFEEILPIVLAFDHVNFLMVVTNLIFAMLIMATTVPESVNRVVFWGLNVGVVGFALGLISENAVIKRIFTPVLGLALLYGIYSYLTAAEPAREELAV